MVPDIIGLFVFSCCFIGNFGCLVCYLFVCGYLSQLIGCYDFVLFGFYACVVLFKFFWWVCLLGLVYCTDFGVSCTIWLILF